MGCSFCEVEKTRTFLISEYIKERKFINYKPFQEKIHWNNTILEEDPAKNKEIKITLLNKESIMSTKSNEIILDPIVLIYKTLVLVVIESNFLEIDSIQISPFFIKYLNFEIKYTQPKEKFIFGKNCYDNDFNFPSNEAVSDNQFEILCPIENNEVVYYVNDSIYGTGIFYKIMQPVIIEDSNCVVSFCKYHMVLYNSNNELNVRLINQDFMEDEIAYSFKPDEKLKITIGRSINSEILINDDSVSRVQGTIVYENNKWTLNDGNDQRASTNGLWKLITDIVQIKEKMVLKTGNTVFSVKIC